MNNPLIYGYIKSLKFNQLTIPKLVFQMIILYSQLKEYLNGQKKINIASKFIGKIIISPFNLLQYDQFEIKWKLKINKIKNASIMIGYQPTEDLREMIKQNKPVKNYERIRRIMSPGKIKTGDNLEILIKYSTGKEYDDMLYQNVIAYIMLNDNLYFHEEKWNHFWSATENYNILYAIFGKIKGEICEIELIDCFENYN